MLAAAFSLGHLLLAIEFEISPFRPGKTVASVHGSKVYDRQFRFPGGFMDAIEFVRELGLVPTTNPDSQDQSGELLMVRRRGLLPLASEREIREKNYGYIL